MEKLEHLGSIVAVIVDLLYKHACKSASFCFRKTARKLTYLVPLSDRFYRLVFPTDEPDNDCHFCGCTKMAMNMLGIRESYT